MFVFKLGHQIYKAAHGSYSFPYPIRDGIEGVSSYITKNWRWEILYLKDITVRSETPLFVYEDIDSAWNDLVEISKRTTSVRLWIAETPQTLMLHVVFYRLLIFVGRNFGQSGLQIRSNLQPTGTYGIM